jgi:hypothetical protein
MPAMGMPSGSPRTPLVTPKTPADGRISGSTSRGTSKSAQSSSSQARFSRSMSRVREALVTSVACTAPPVSFQSSALSTVPKQSSPRCARARAPFTLSSSQRSLVPLK